LDGNCVDGIIILILSLVGVVIRRGLDGIFGFIALIHLARNYKKYNAIADLHFTVYRYTHITVLSSLVVSRQRTSKEYLY
jgi:hypothetical protein